MSEENINDQLVLITGFSATGKSASFRNLAEPEKVMYLGTEAGKRLPFPSKFKVFKIIDPYQVQEALDYLLANPGEFNTLIIDSLTFLMEMFETQYVLRSSNTMKGWSDYQQFFKEMIQEKIASLTIPVLITAHLKDTLDEKAMEIKTRVPIKGALQNNGIESYFSTVVSAKKVSLNDLSDYKNDMLHITEEDEILGYKHVYQTRLTKKTVGETIRSPIGLFSRNETYIDNNAQILLNHLNNFYKE